MKKVFKKVAVGTQTGKKISGIICGVVGVGAYNIVLQFAVYPYFERSLGAARYGVVLSLISFAAMLAATCGGALNYSRLLGQSYGVSNGDCNVILLCLSVACAVAGVIYLGLQGGELPVFAPAYAAFIVLNTVRYYAEVEFRIKTDFFGYMIYFILICAGYVTAILIFRSEIPWIYVLICGELAAIVFVIFRGNILRPPFFSTTPQLRRTVLRSSYLGLAFFIDNLTLHADRIFLYSITGSGEAVTSYYIASLVGKAIALVSVPLNSVIISYLAKYGGALTRKMWGACVLAATAVGAVAFLGSVAVSPTLISMLYGEEGLALSQGLILPAVAGQVLYFVSGVMMTFLLRFIGERAQLAFNFAYAVEFFACIAIGAAVGELYGFVIGVLAANFLKLVSLAVLGFAVVLWTKRKNTLRT